MKEVFGVKVVRQTKVHVLRKYLPRGQWMYSIRHGDTDREPATIEKEVFVNFKKYLITEGPIEWIEENPKCNYIQIHKGGELTKERDCKDGEGKMTKIYQPRAQCPKCRRIIEVELAQVIPKCKYCELQMILLPEHLWRVKEIVK